jgi:uncharacterized protein (TIGR03435 family)
MLHRSVFVIGQLIGMSLGNAQSPAFEVASVKLAAPGDRVINLGTVSHGQVTLTNVSLSDALKFAYGITNDVQISGPDWIRDKRVAFSIVAKAAPETPVSQLLLMLQSLLIERFKLALHREQRDLSVMALTVGKAGPTFQEAKDGSDGSTNTLGPGKIISNRISMPVLASLLSRWLREPVVDRTELTGSYALKLEWTYTPGQAPLEAGRDSGTSIFAAVQEQLGLKLQARKGPLEVIVIDHAERAPIAN